MKPVVIPIAREERKEHLLFSALLIFLNLVVMLLLAFGSNAMLFRSLYGVGVVFNFFSLLTLRYRGLAFNQFFKPRNVLIINGLIWIFTGNYFFGFLMLGTGFLAFYLSKKQRIIISDAGITHQHLTTTNFNWSDIETIIVKNGIITVNLSNNKMIQEQIETGFPIESLNEKIEEFRLGNFQG